MIEGGEYRSFLNASLMDEELVVCSAQVHALMPMMSFLVSPVVEKGVGKRFVVFPKGQWKSEQGDVIKGGKTLEIDVPLERLPYFQKLN